MMPASSHLISKRYQKKKKLYKTHNKFKMGPRREPARGGPAVKRRESLHFCTLSTPHKSTKPHKTGGRSFCNQTTLQTRYRFVSEDQNLSCHMRKQDIRTHAQTRHKLGTRIWIAQKTDHYPEQGSASSAKQHPPPPNPTNPARVHRGSPSAACYQRSTEKASQEPRGGRRP